MMMSTGMCGRIQKSCMPKIISSKKELQRWDFNSFILGSKFRFLGDSFRAFEPVFFFSCHQLTMVAYICTKAPTIKKIPTVLLVIF